VPAVFVVCLNETKAIFGGPKAAQSTEDVRWPTALMVSLRCVANRLKWATCETEGSVKPGDVVFGYQYRIWKEAEGRPVSTWHDRSINEGVFNGLSTHRAEFEIIEDWEMQDFRTFLGGITAEEK